MIVSPFSGVIIADFIALAWCLACILLSIVQHADTLGLTFGKMMCRFMCVLLLQLIVILVILGINCLTCVLLDSLKRSLSYYSVKIFAFCFYVLNSMMAGIAVTHYCLNRFKGRLLPLHTTVQFLLHSHAIWVCVIFIFPTRFNNYMLHLFSIYVYCVSVSLHTLTLGLRHIPKIGKHLYHGKFSRILTFSR